MVVTCWAHGVLVIYYVMMNKCLTWKKVSLATKVCDGWWVGGWWIGGWVVGGLLITSDGWWVVGWWRCDIERDMGSV